MVALLAILLAVFLLVVVPALAIYGVVRARTQDRELQRLAYQTAQLTRRLHHLEHQAQERASGQAPSLPPAAASDTMPAPGGPVPSTLQPVGGGIVAAPAATPAAAPAGGWRLPRREPIDWESLIAGRWLNVIGIAALLLAVAFFLGYAFENEWIGPAGRVALGLLTGAALLVGSERLLRAGYRYFAEGVAGLGGGVLYLSLYAAWAYYELFPQSAAFGGMTVVTLALMLLAAGRRSERIALVALAGGFAAPILLRTGVDQQIVLFSYVAALNTGTLALTQLRRWRIVDLAAFAGTQLLFWGWYTTYWTPARLLPTAFFATLFFALFGVAAFARLRGAERPAPAHLVLVLSNAFAFLLVLRAILWPAHRWTLTLAVLALAVMHLAIARSAAGRSGTLVSGVPLMRLVYAGLALAFATLAIPVRLEGRWITIGWAIEGALLVWSGFITRMQFLRIGGLVLLGVVVVRVLTLPIAADRFLLNARFLTLVAVGLCLAAAAWFSRDRRALYFRYEEHLYAAVAIAAHVLFVWALTTDTWQWIGRLEQPLGVESRDLRQVVVPAIWAVYGAVLILAGFRWELPALRWLGLPLTGMAAGALLVQEMRSDAFLLNPRFAAYAVAAAALYAIGRAARQGAIPGEGERLLYRIVPVVLNLLLLVALSHEVWDLSGRGRAVSDVGYARSMGLSILWAGYATALIAAGVRGADPLLRWMALFLFGIVVVKVFFFDLSGLDRGYRILSFFVLGVLLLAVSFLYTRRLAAARAGESP